MERREFVKTCGFACMGTTTLGLLLQGCVGSKMITAQIEGDNMVIPLHNFIDIKKEVQTFKKYLVVQNEQLKFPICVYRVNGKEYTALYMQCSHQGVELTAYGDKLFCSAHGSEFDQLGKVTSGPAEKHLRTFPVIVENQNLKISLRES